jgi:hypothetical protein
MILTRRDHAEKNIPIAGSAHLCGLKMTETGHRIHLDL